MSFKLTVLGSSSALPTSTRFPTAHLLNVDERFFLIDCGEGAQIQLRKYKARFSRLNHIFISHLHGDHIFGLPGLISTLGLLDRKQELNIYSPPELELMIKSIFKQLNSTIPFSIKFHVLKPGLQLIYEDKRISIVSFPLKHRIPSYGFLFKEKPKQKNVTKQFVDQFNPSIKDILLVKAGNDFTTPSGDVIPNKSITAPCSPEISYAFCTDTLCLDEIIPIIENATLLYHEATFMHQDAAIAKETYHSTAVQAATIAKNANVKKLLIGHFSSRYKDLLPMLNEATDIFKNTTLANDGDEFDLESLTKL